MGTAGVRPGGEDGSVEVVDDAEGGSVGTIKMSREQAVAFARWVEENVKS